MRTEERNSDAVCEVVQKIRTIIAGRGLGSQRRLAQARLFICMVRSGGLCFNNLRPSNPLLGNIPGDTKRSLTMDVRTCISMMRKYSCLYTYNISGQTLPFNLSAHCQTL